MLCYSSCEVTNSHLLHRWLSGLLQDSKPQAHGLTLYQMLTPWLPRFRTAQAGPWSLCSRSWLLPLSMITHMEDYFKRQVKVPFGRKDWNTSYCQMMTAVTTLCCLTNIHGSINHNNQKVSTNNMTINYGQPTINQQSHMVYTYSGKVFGHKKGWSTSICYNMTWGHKVHAERYPASDSV